MPHYIKWFRTKVMPYEFYLSDCKHCIMVESTEEMYLTKRVQNSIESVIRIPKHMPCTDCMVCVTMSLWHHNSSIFKFQCLASHWSFVILESKAVQRWLLPDDAIWRLSSWSTLAQVMFCCHYSNLCWPVISEGQWHSPGANFVSDTSAIKYWN